MPNTNPTAATYALILAETIREVSAVSPLGGVPNGELWTRVSGYMTFEAYTAIIAALKRTKLVAERNYLLTWEGPRLS